MCIPQVVLFGGPPQLLKPLRLKGTKPGLGSSDATDGLHTNIRRTPAQSTEYFVLRISPSLIRTIL